MHDWKTRDLSQPSRSDSGEEWPSSASDQDQRGRGAALAEWQESALKQRSLAASAAEAAATAKLQQMLRRWLRRRQQRQQARQQMQQQEANAAAQAAAAAAEAAAVAAGGGGSKHGRMQRRPGEEAWWIQHPDKWRELYAYGKQLGWDQPGFGQQLFLDSLRADGSKAALMQFVEENSLDAPGAGSMEEMLRSFAQAYHYERRAKLLGSRTAKPEISTMGEFVRRIRGGSGDGCK